jgi:cleavage and polyadenylation specificity factor subunit 5
MSLFHCNAEVDGLKRKLGAYLWPDNPLLHTTWEVGECLGTWWRPNFDTVFYPYIPPHISKPKESKKLFIVPLAEKARFGVSAWVTTWLWQGVCQLDSSTI